MCILQKIAPKGGNFLADYLHAYQSALGDKLSKRVGVFGDLNFCLFYFAWLVCNLNGKSAFEFGHVCIPSVWLLSFDVVIIAQRGGIATDNIINLINLISA